VIVNNSLCVVLCDRLFSLCKRCLRFKHIQVATAAIPTQHNQHHAAVLLPTGFGVVIGDRFVFTIAEEEMRG
jgi:hypothetical protein